MNALVGLFIQNKQKKKEKSTGERKFLRNKIVRGKKTEGGFVIFFLHTDLKDSQSLLNSFYSNPNYPLKHNPNYHLKHDPNYLNYFQAIIRFPQDAVL